ncbi:MAG TPA: 50S ribosomal protein L3 N(5)-glutamine methyltransferase [Steroidobacteraceae bacterium]|nr:50S ribosomal protein L3 N(5)-glutamine methyltransferase [Steroidobacteraceae bacterium]
MNAPPLPPALTATAIDWAARRLARAHLSFGHGSDNARDEAAALVFHAAGWPHSAAPAAYRWRLTRAARESLGTLVRRRIVERMPAAYLTGVTWFAGHEIRIDPRVLVPRSPIAELILHRFQPFVRPERVRRILDIGTGSGCIAIACAHAFPAARIDAIDVSAGALEVARDNIRRHRLERRVRLRRASVYRGLGTRRYDIIVSNPPYVPAGEVAALPAEYRHEPRIALAAGTDGLSVVGTILRGAVRHLAPGGVLVVEVGDSAGAVAATWPGLPFLWLGFEHGGGGVFLMTREQLAPRPRQRARRSTRAR